MRPLSHSRLKRAVTLLSIVAVMSVSVYSAGGPAARGVARAQDMRGMSVVSKSDAARQKVHPLLLQRMQQAPNEMVRVRAYVKAGTDLTRFMPDALSPVYASPTGYAMVVGTVKAANVVKLAGINGVATVTPLTGIMEPALYANRDRASGRVTLSADQQARLTAWTQRGTQQAQVGANAGGTGGPQANGWFDVLAGSDAKLAWDKGYTGAGVKVMVNDSGIDFAQPDMMGTEARVTDPSSPYYGWPMQFDAFSMYLMARDFYLGETNIADGSGQYADTSTVITMGASDYQPLDAAAPYTYTLPATSRSGVYHIGTHPDNSLRAWYRIINGIPLDDTAARDERPAVLVVDENQSGVYDTVYIDLNFNYDFTDDKPIRKGDEISGIDWWGAMDAEGNFAPEPDGMYDESGGMVYWISDGVNPVPAADWWWGIGAAGNGTQDNGEAAAGNLVLFTILDTATSPAGDHGQLTSSAVVAQGRSNGQYGALGDQIPPYKPAETTGAVVGAGPGVQLVSAGDTYSYGVATDPFYFAALGYDGVPGTADDVQIISNSWGISSFANEGWDFMSREIDAIVRLINPTLLSVQAAGNGAPGFGTVTQPAPQAGLKVGASTQYGSTVIDSAAGADQITYGDVAFFSGRGPGARGIAGIDLVANGSVGTGAMTLNETFSGASAWQTWAGTSRSAPMAAGNAALAYQAYYQANGVWPDYATIKAILMSGARDLNYGAFQQGSGSINGNRAVDIASGAVGGYVTPSEWTPGDYNGVNYPGFANVLFPGESSDMTFSYQNPGANPVEVTVGDRWLQKISTWQQDFLSAPITNEPIQVDPEDPSATVRNVNAPQYLWNWTDQVPANTDLMVYTIDIPYEQFDPEGSYDPNRVNNWRAYAYDWTDVNGDGNLWEDGDGDGVVDDGELDQGEYMRLAYSNNVGTSAQITIQRPRERVHDGLFIGLVHDSARVDVPQTTIKMNVDYYQQVDFPWMTQYVNTLSVAAGGSNSVRATVSVPADAPIGIYEAALTFSDGYWTSVVPVTVNVAARGANVDTGQTSNNSFYDNGRVAGMQDWTWREESGDWRFYYTDLSDTAGLGNLAGGAQYLIADVGWQNMPTDINAYIFGPTADCFSQQIEDCPAAFDPYDPSYYGPYTLGFLGGSDEYYVGDGVFLTSTSSSTNREFTAAPYTPGLNFIALQNVNYAGRQTTESISLRAGSLAVSSSPIDVSRTTFEPNASVSETMVSTLPLSGLVADGFGFSAPETFTGQTVRQDDPNDPSSASYKKQLTLQHAGLLNVAVNGGASDDLDLYVVYDANNDGQFTADEIIASSTTPTANESVSITLPADGNYEIWVHGWNVPLETTTFDLTVNAVQGNDISVSSLPVGGIEPRQQYSFTVDFNGEGLAPGVYTGLVTLGPPEGPAAVKIPVSFQIRE